MIEPLRHDYFGYACRHDGRGWPTRMDPFSAEFLAAWPDGEERHREDVPGSFHYTSALEGGYVTGAYTPPITGALPVLMVRSAKPAPDPLSCYYDVAGHWPYGVDAHWHAYIRSPARTAYRELRNQVGKMAAARVRTLGLGHELRRIGYPEIASQRVLLTIRRQLVAFYLAGGIPDTLRARSARWAQRIEQGEAFRRRLMLWLLVEPRISGGAVTGFGKMDPTLQCERLDPLSALGAQVAELLKGA
jgi:hypothetical protein